jgi:hypothetical protein
MFSLRVLRVFVVFPPMLKFNELLGLDSAVASSHPEGLLHFNSPRPIGAN